MSGLGKGICLLDIYHYQIVFFFNLGSEGGLRLHLNIEQYEYMKGPNSGAGLKMQVHNPDENHPLYKNIQFQYLCFI